jgi:hypothetical protein
MDNQLSVKPNKPDNTKKLLRDVLIFQGKLALDGIRDIILSPIAVIAAIYGSITHPENPSIYFQSLMQFGRKTDDFINLFEHRSHTESPSEAPKSDDYVDQIEAALSKQIEKENAFFRKKSKNGDVQNETPDSNNEPGKNNT